MPKNNSKERKMERIAAAHIRDDKSVLRSCGHFHTDNGAARCKDNK